jgi:hypothetical protein
MVHYFHPNPNVTAPTHNNEIAKCIWHHVRTLGELRVDQTVYFFRIPHVLFAMC